MLEKKLLLIKLVVYSLAVYWDFLRRAASARVKAQIRRLLKRPQISNAEPRNIVIVGASFAGYQAARLLAPSLPSDGKYRIVVIEPNSHFNFTWVLPRFCVVSDHEHKAFIPYTPYLTAVAPPGGVRWVKDRVTAVNRTSVRLRDSEEETPYDFLVLATGSGDGEVLPSRVGSEKKVEGIELLRGVQRRIRDAEKIVVVGGGAAGVELATDAKAVYPEKHVVLVHSRDAVMHRFGPELQEAALKGLTDLGVEVILGERVVGDSGEKGIVSLSSGRTVECDYLVRISPL
jgi:NADH dehydrogenase FAD-containing subunit